MNRLLPLLILVLIGLSASAAFDMRAWMEKRQCLTEEADRLRVAYTNCLTLVQQPAEDVDVSIETYPDGAVKTQVAAKRAQFFLDKALVWAEGVVLRKFKQDGSLDIRIDANSCVIDRQTNSGWAEGATKITQNETVFSGKGVYFSSTEGYVKVFSDTEMESKNLKMGGLRP